MDTDSAAWPFLEHAVVRSWKSGALIHMWTPASGIFYVLSGTVHVVRLLESGERSILHVVGKDNFFFENRYFHPHPRTSVAYAAADTQTAYLSPEKVEFLLGTSLAFCHALIDDMSRKNLNSGKNIVDACRRDPEFRLLSALYGLSCRKGDAPVRRLRITQSCLAEYVGKHPVTINKILRKLEEQGFLHLGRGSITLEVERIIEELRRHSE